MQHDFGRSMNENLPSLTMMSSDIDSGLEDASWEINTDRNFKGLQPILRVKDVWF